MEIKDRWTFNGPKVPLQGNGSVMKSLQLRVAAMDWSRTRLDSNPKTPVALKKDGTGWDNFENEKGISGRGGVDINHRIKLGSPTKKVGSAAGSYDRFRAASIFGLKDAKAVFSDIDRFYVSGDWIVFWEKDYQGNISTEERGKGIRLQGKPPVSTSPRSIR